LASLTEHSAHFEKIIPAKPVKWADRDREVGFAHWKLLHFLPNFAILLRVASFDLLPQEIAGHDKRACQALISGLYQPYDLCSAVTDMPLREHRT
jgi:hypothetical protein